MFEQIMKYALQGLDIMVSAVACPDMAELTSLHRSLVCCRVYVSELPLCSIAPTGLGKVSSSLPYGSCMKLIGMPESLLSRYIVSASCNWERES